MKSNGPNIVVEGLSDGLGPESKSWDFKLELEAQGVWVKGQLLPTFVFTQASECYRIFTNGNP